MCIWPQSVSWGVKPLNCRKDKSWTTGEAAGTMMVDGFKRCDRNTVGKTVTAACGERESNLSNSTDGKVTPWEEIQLGTSSQDMENLR